MRTLENRWALVTGSSRGVGREIAVGLAKRKCNVIVHGRELGNTRATVEAVKACGVRAAAAAGDLASREGVAALIAAAHAASGPIDILYNNAAIQNPWKPRFEIPPEDWQAVFQVNVFAMVALCNAFVPAMVRRNFGRVVNLTSGIQDTPSLAPYSVSKAAVDKFTRDLAAELRGKNVLANTLDPGWLRTDMGGPNGEHDVSTVLPGALVPALLDDNGPSGRFFAAQDYSCLE